MFTKGDTVWVDVGVQELPAVVVNPALDEAIGTVSVRIVDAERTSVHYLDALRPRNPAVPERRKVPEFIPARRLTEVERAQERAWNAAEIRRVANCVMFRIGRMDLIR